MITFDGDRSKKLLWFAKKKLKVITNLNLPSSAIKFNGFLVRVWRLSKSLWGGRITAPMGAVVLYSSFDGISIMTNDYWKGAVNGRQPLWMLFRQLVSSIVFNIIQKPTEEQMILDGFKTVQYFPQPVSSPYYATSPGGIFPPSPTYENDSMPTPGIIPALAGEAFWTLWSGMTAPDLDDDGLPDYGIPREQNQLNLNFYSSDGSNLGNRLSAAFEYQIPFGGTWKARTFTPMPSTKLSYVELSVKQYTIVSSEKVAGLHISGDIIEYDPINFPGEYISGRYWTVSNLVQHMPSGLQTAISQSDAYAEPVGNWAYSNIIDADPILMTAIDLTRHGRSTVDPVAQWFIDNPGNDDWKLTLHFNILGSTSVVTFNASNFMSVLDTMATVNSPQRVFPSANWDDAVWMMQQLFARPGHDFSVPYDNMMFNDEFDNVYVWTRLYGSFKFSHTTGIASITINVDSTVTATPGVRPTITHAGDGLYLMVSEELNPPLRVKAIHYGSPFTSWDTLPIPTHDPVNLTESYLLHVRPVRVAVDDVILLGIIEKIVDSAEGTYHMAFLNYDIEGGEWVEMTKLPVVRSIEPDMSLESQWAISLFGKGKFVNEINKYLTQHPIMPQMPVPSAYVAYETGMP